MRVRASPCRRLLVDAMARRQIGQLTEFGPALREPCGRIHWAGTESSAVMYGFIDGAVRSGEQAATEVIAREAVPVA